MVIALGEPFSGVFSTSDTLWEQLRVAGEVEYDHFWRMPLDDDFGVTRSQTSDTLLEPHCVAGEPEYDRFWGMALDDFGVPISNADLRDDGGRPGEGCTTALFLKSFTNGIEAKAGQEPALKWAHIDIAGSMEVTHATPYMEKGMSGRPVRALVEYVRRLSTN